MRILIADDDYTSLALLTRNLEKMGYEILSASDGAEAWEILQNEKISLIITDWLMPKMDGLDLCKKIRSSNFSHYIYIIMLTSKESKLETIQGMEAGADDFIIKPFNNEELKVRIRAGERIIKLEKDLEEHNNKLEEAYSVIKKDLEAAANIQSSLLPKSASDILGIRFDWLFLPSAFVAGDIFNYFNLVGDYIGFYILDVAGHGIPAAMLSVALSKFISPSNIQDNPLKRLTHNPPYYEITDPAEVIHSLNERFLANDDSMQYFTMIYGIMNAITGEIKFTQAGHPSPIILNSKGKARVIGTGGYPVAMLPNVEYDEHEIYLNRGDRLILYSDGITECLNGNKEQFKVERLLELSEESRDLPLNDMLLKIKQGLRNWHGDSEFEDDVTLLVMERC